MNALFAPLPAVLIAILLSVGATTFWFQGQITRMLGTITTHRAEKVEAARPEAPWDFWTPEMELVARELDEHRKALAGRDAELQQREARLARERQELDQIRRDIEALRADLDSRLIQVDAQELRNLKSLVNTYSKLTPAATVAIFKELDDALVAKILSQMKVETSTAILQEFHRDPGPDNVHVKRAAELTRRMRLLMPAAGAPPGAR